MPKNNELAFRNGSATYHQLLTISAFDQTSYKTHKFIPLVTLGEISNKNIPW